MHRIAATVALAMALGTLPDFAFALPCPSIFGCGGHPAPAPLLAAGAPAFAALGGGAVISGWLRRLRDRRPRKQSE